MEFYGKRSLFSFIDEEKKTSQTSPTYNIPFKSHQESTDHHRHQDQTLQFNHTNIPTNQTMLKLLSPQSPESPWTLSPLQTPSPSLLFNCIASLHRQEGNIYSISCSKGLIFTGSESTRIRAWKQPDCTETGCLRASSGEVKAILAYGNTIFTSHRDRKVRIWNFSHFSDNFTSKRVSSVPGTRKSSFFWLPKIIKTSQTQIHHKDCISCMAYYNPEGLLYTGSYDRTVKAWRVSDKKCVDSFIAHEDNVNAIVLNQEDGCVFTCSSDGSVKIWRRVYKENSHSLTMTLKLQQFSPVKAIALSSYFNNSILYAGSCDGTINFWEKEKLSYRYNHGGVLQGHSFSVLCLSVLEKLIFSGSEDTTIRVWRREESVGNCCHECLAVLDGHRGPVRCLAVCLEIEDVVMGVLVYSASVDQILKVWRVKCLDGEKMCLDYNDRSGSRTSTKMEYEVSPVLSPSWVEKKLRTKLLKIN